MVHSPLNEPRKWLSCGITLCLLGGGRVLPAAEIQPLRLPKGNESQLSASKSSPDSQQTFQPLQQSSAVSVVRNSVSLAPAVVAVKCKFSQSYTQVVTLFNQREQNIAFEMVAEDVVVRDGKRGFVPAGETRGSIAATAIFSQKQGVIAPGQSASVGVTFTVPPETPLRAAVALFRRLHKVSDSGSVMMTASLGALFTFTVSDNTQIEASPITVSAQSPTANLGISQVLTNTGSEPVVAGGVAAVLSDTGMLVGKASFEEQRLLPGERLLFRAEYPAELKPGNYRVFASFQYEDKVVTNSTDFTVP
jgi:hypothetical protein